MTNHQNLVRLEDSIPETKLVAIIRQEPSEIEKLIQVAFKQSFDDLDYLIYARLSLPSRNKIALVRHENSPSPGTEICVTYNQQNTLSVLQETITKMNLNFQDFTWIHPDHEQQLKEFLTVFENKRSR